MKPQKQDRLAETLGQNIRRARLECGLTQGQLADGEITRNMLSLIENGSALPSLSTLCRLAERLELPPGALLDDLSGYNAVRLERELHSMLVKKQYSKLIERFEQSGSNAALCEAGLAYIIRQAFVSRAYELYELGRITEAGALLDRFEQSADCPGYDIAAIIDRAFILRLTLAIASGKSADESEHERLNDMIFSRSEEAIYLYACTLLEGAQGKAYSVPDDNLGYYKSMLEPLLERLKPGFVRTHIEAKLLMCAADYLGAKALMLPLLTGELAPSRSCELLCDLEHCCKCCGDFENAYKYSTRRLELVRTLK